MAEINKQNTLYVVYYGWLNTENIWCETCFQNFEPEVKSNLREKLGVEFIPRIKTSLEILTYQFNNALKCKECSNWVNSEIPNIMKLKEAYRNACSAKFNIKSTTECEQPILCKPKSGCCECEQLKFENEKLKFENEQLKFENEQIKLAITCTICTENRISIVLSCGHTFCGECAEEVQTAKPICPLCRCVFASKIKMFGFST